MEQPVDLWSVADRFAARAESFIAEEAEAERPFFMYLALTHTHVPHTPASCFRKEAEAEIRKVLQQADCAECACGALGV